MATSPEMLRMMAEYQRDVRNEADRTVSHYKSMHEKLGDINKELKTASERMGKWMTDSKNFDLSPIKMGLEALSKVPIAGFFAKWAMGVENINQELKQFEGTFIKASAAFVQGSDRLGQVQDTWSAANGTLSELVSNLHVSQQTFAQLTQSMNGMGHAAEVFNASMSSSDKNVSVLTATIQFAQATGQDYTKVLGDMSNVMLNFGSSSRDASKAMEGVHRGFTIIASSAAQTGMPISYVQDQIMKATSGFEDYAISVGSAMGGVAETFTQVFSAAQDKLGKQGRAGPLTQKLISGMTGMDLGTRGIIGESMGLGAGLEGAGKYSVLRSTNLYESILGATGMIESKIGPGSNKSYNALVGEGLLGAGVLSEKEREELIARAGPGASGLKLMRTYTDDMNGTIDAAKMAKMPKNEHAFARSTAGMKMYQQTFGLNEQEAIQMMDMDLKKGPGGKLSEKDQKVYDNLMKSGDAIQREQLTELQQLSNFLFKQLGGVEGIAGIAKTVAGGLIGTLGTILLETFGVLKGDTLGTIIGAGIVGPMVKALDQIPAFKALHDMAANWMETNYPEVAEFISGIDSSAIGSAIIEMWNSVKESGFYKDSVKWLASLGKMLGLSEEGAAAGRSTSKTIASSLLDRLTKGFDSFIKALQNLGNFLWSGLEMLGEKMLRGTHSLADSMLAGLQGVFAGMKIVTPLGTISFGAGAAAAIGDARANLNSGMGGITYAGATMTPEQIGSRVGGWRRAGATLGGAGGGTSAMRPSRDKELLQWVESQAKAGTLDQNRLELEEKLAAMPPGTALRGADAEYIMNIVGGASPSAATLKLTSRHMGRYDRGRTLKAGQEQLGGYVNTAGRAGAALGVAARSGLSSMGGSLQKLGKTGMDKARGLMKHLMSKAGGGYSAAQAAGMVGNAMVESDRFRADHAYGGEDSRGYMQWHGPRKTAFEEWSDSKGFDLTDPEEFDLANMGYMTHENELSQHWSGGMSTSKYRDIKHVDEATEKFMRYNERPRDDSSLQQRMAFGRLFYNEFSGNRTDDLFEGPGGGDIQSDSLDVQRASLTALHGIQKSLTEPRDSRVIATCDRCKSETFKAAAEGAVVDGARDGTYGVHADRAIA